MAIDKTPKLCGLAAFGVGGWLLPLAFNLSPAIEGFSLSLGCFSSAALCLETRRETIVSGIKETEKRLSMERVAYELVLSHEKELQAMREFYGFGDDSDDDDGGYAPTQSKLTGGYMNQPTIAGGNGETIGAAPGVVPFDLDWLLRSNSQHLLVTGSTGSGKTTFIQWVIRQINPHTIKVYDPDFDGVTDWGGEVVTAPNEDYTEIRANMRLDLTEFEQRVPNDPQLRKVVFVAEEMASLIPEGKEDALKWLKVLLRRGRKRSLFVVGVAQDRNVESLGLKSAGLLNNFTILYLGGYAFDALDRIRDRNYRNGVRAELEKYSRPALVQYEGRFYPWNIPDLSSTASNQTPKPSTQTIAAEEGTIATLNRTLQAPVATKLHWDVVDFAISRGDWVSVRDAMRGVSGIRTADECKQFFQDLVGLELGETRHDAKHDRLLFKAFQ